MDMLALAGGAVYHNLRLLMAERLEAQELGSLK